MSDPRRCWAPCPVRPLVKQSIVREYVYAYAAVSPVDGVLEWQIAPTLNAEQMGQFLAHVKARHPGEFLVIVLDGAGAHRAKDLAKPDNVELIFLPAYSPELNPVEHLWDEMKEKEFANRVFDSLDAVTATAREGLTRLAGNQPAIQKITGWKWILESF